MSEHILIVDDDEDLLSTLKLLFQREEYDVATVSDGEKALNYIMHTNEGLKPVDLLITDLKMPNMSGFELIHKLHKERIQLPVIVISGCINQKTADGLLHKVCEYFEKPVNSKELTKCVNTLLS